MTVVYMGVAFKRGASKIVVFLLVPLEAKKNTSVLKKGHPHLGQFFDLEDFRVVFARFPEPALRGVHTLHGLCHGPQIDRRFPTGSVGKEKRYSWGIPVYPQKGQTNFGQFVGTLAETNTHTHVC